MCFLAPIKHLHISNVRIVACIVLRVDLFIVEYQNQLVHKIFCVFLFFFFCMYVFGQPCCSECECTLEFVSLPGYASSVTDKWPNMGNFLVQEVGLIG